MAECKNYTYVLCRDCKKKDGCRQYGHFKVYIVPGCLVRMDRKKEYVDEVKNEK